jgi:hypothetical protein
MAIHRAARLAMMPAAIQHSPKRKPRPYDPLLDDEGLYPTAEEIAHLPDPIPLLPTIATLVVEVIAGARSVDQVSALVSDQVYEKLRSKVAARARAEAAAGRPVLMPKFAIGSIRHDSPRPGVIESVVLIKSAVRTRAVTIRLEPFHQRWRATSVTIL